MYLMPDHTYRNTDVDDDDDEKKQQKRNRLMDRNLTLFSIWMVLLDSLPKYMLLFEIFNIKSHFIMQTLKIYIY